VKIEKKELFEEEKKGLVKLLKEKQQKMDDEVIDILETWLYMLKRYPEAVKDLDMEKLREYMAEKAENFHEKYREKYLNEERNKVVIEKNVVYIYDFSSISFLLGSTPLLYPFMLLYAANYWNFISILCRKLQKIDVNDQIMLEDFLRAFIDMIQRRSKPKLTKRDIEFLKELTSFGFDSRKEFTRIYRKYQTTKQYRRLDNLRVLCFYRGVNFSSLNLTPYMHLSDYRFKIPDGLKAFIEQKLGKSKIFRLFLVPAVYEKKWADELSRLGVTSKLESWEIRYNWDSLFRTARGFCKWKLEIFSDFASLPDRDTDATSVKYDLYYKIDGEKKLTMGFVTFLETIHRMETTNPEALAAMTGFKINTIRKYLQDAIDRKIILPSWLITQLGLNSLYQVCIKNSKVNYRLIAFLETLPKVKVMKSEAFSRYLLFLPPVAVNKLNRSLKNSVESGNFEILSREKLFFDSTTIDKGVDLLRLWKSIEKK
jgi:hypothetical protein